MNNGQLLRSGAAVAVLSVVLAIPGMASAGERLVDFDDLPNGFLGDQLDPLGVDVDAHPRGFQDCTPAAVLSESGLASSGVRYATTGGVGTEQKQGRVCLGFPTPTKLVRLQGGVSSLGIVLHKLSLIAYDVGGQPLGGPNGSATILAVPGASLAGAWRTLQVSAPTPTIRWVVLQAGEATGGPDPGTLPLLDDLAWDTDAPVATTFTLAANGGGHHIRGASTMTVPVDVHRYGDVPSNGPITLSTAGLPAGVTATFQPATLGGSAAHQQATLTLAATDLPESSFVYTITATPAGPAVGPAPVSVDRSASVVTGLVVRALGGAVPKIEALPGYGRIDAFDCSKVSFPVSLEVPSSDSPPPGAVYVQAEDVSPGIQASLQQAFAVPSEQGWLPTTERRVDLDIGTLPDFGGTFILHVIGPGVDRKLPISVPEREPVITEVEPWESTTPMLGAPGSSVTVKTQGLCGDAKFLEFGNAQAIVPTTASGPGGSVLTATVPRLGTSGLRVVDLLGHELAREGSWLTPSTVVSYRSRWGFPFPNYPIKKISWDDMVDYFGKDDTESTANGCAWSVVGYCPFEIRNPVALAWLEIARSFLVDDPESGHCFGMSFVALATRQGRIKFGDATHLMPIELGGPGGPESSDLDRMLRLNSLGNFSSQFMFSWLVQSAASASPASLRKQLTDSFALGAPMLLSLRKGTWDGHVVVAYDVEPVEADGSYWIRVYNPNKPFTAAETADGALHAQVEGASRVRVKSNGTWTFPMGDGQWSGQLRGLAESLVALPLSSVPKSPSLVATDLVALTPLGAAPFGLSDTASPRPRATLAAALDTGAGVVPIPLGDGVGGRLVALRPGTRSVAFHGQRDGAFRLQALRGGGVVVADVDGRAGLDGALVLLPGGGAGLTTSGAAPFRLELSPAAGAIRRVDVRGRGTSADLTLTPGGGLVLHRGGSVGPILLELQLAAGDGSVVLPKVALADGDGLALEPGWQDGLTRGRVTLEVRRGASRTRTTVAVTRKRPAGAALTATARRVPHGVELALGIRLPKALGDDATLDLGWLVTRGRAVVGRHHVAEPGDLLPVRRVERWTLTGLRPGTYRLQASAVIGAGAAGHRTTLRTLTFRVP